MPLPFYPLIPYLQASDHIATVGVANTMLFIVTPVSATHWRILSRAVCPGCDMTGYGVGPTSFFSVEDCGVDSGSTLLVV